MTKPSILTPSNVQEKLFQAIDIVREGGQLGLDYFYKLSKINGVSISEKSTLNFVSEADLAVEALIKKSLQLAFPDDAFIGEETTHEKKSDEATTTKEYTGPGYWVLDPIDGTANFISQLDDWSVSLAYYDCEQAKTTIGIVYQPTHDRLFYALAGGGVYRDGIRLPRIDRPLSEMASKASLIGIGTSSMAPPEVDSKILNLLKKNHLSYRKLASCALMLTHVATGSYHGYFEPHINSWDCLAGRLMVEELGGVSNDFLANDGLYRGNILLVATPARYPILEPLLAEFDAPNVP